MGFLNRSSDELEDMYITETDPNRLKSIENELLRRGAEEDREIARRYGIDEDE